MLTPTFTSLPPDNFDVHVENEIDERKLLWLVNTIGEQKLRSSANKRGKYYPDRKLFVTKLLKRFHLKVPPQVYVGVNVPIDRVYLLVLCDQSAIKIGVTQRWPNRAYDFVKTADYSRTFDDEIGHLFDPNLSLAFYAGSKVNAVLIEGSIKQKFANSSAPSPCHRGLIPFSCGGHSEWYFYSAYDEILSNLSVMGESESLDTSMRWRSMASINTLSVAPGNRL